MARNWDKYSRQGLDLVHTASSFAFSTAKVGTRFGFSITRGVATTAVSATTTVLDFALFGGSTVTRPVFGLAVSTVLTVAEQLTLAPIHLSEYITSTSLLAAHSSINVLSVIFPGSSEASFSLPSFIDLVRREWGNPGGLGVPGKQYGIAQVTRATVAWVSLQGVTQEWQEQRWLRYLKEINVHNHTHKHHGAEPRLHKKPSRVRVTSDVIFPGQQGPQIIAADIGDPEPSRSRASSIYHSRTKSHVSLHHSRGSVSTIIDSTTSTANIEELKATLRRLSKMVLAGYGGASLLFFGISPSAFGSNSKPSTSIRESMSMDREKTTEEAKLATAVDASEAEAAGDDILTEEPELTEPSQTYSWWNMLLGKHDQEIFERSTSHADDQKASSSSKADVNKTKIKATAVVGDEHLMPRFWVLTDHGRSQVVLVIRGTMSLNEIVVDLTCEAEEFQPAMTPVVNEDDEDAIPGQFAFPEKEKNLENGQPKYLVHGGILRLARLMGEPGKPVQLAVMEALYNNPGYELVLSGHSLGAGVAAMLAMMWADPKTCLTVRSSGLPLGRSVKAYCLACPCLTDAALSRLCDNLIVSLVYSHDIVSRISLGSTRDLRNVAMWLCEAQETGDGSEGWSSLTARAKKWKDGKGSPEDFDWFIAMRKTLEANMQNSNLFPVGRVLWAMRDGDLHPSHQLRSTPKADKEKLRLFEVLDVEKVFCQLVFASNMLTAHLPHQYDRVLHYLL